MPHKPLKPCLLSGCIQIVLRGYCQAHAHFYTPLQDRNRPTAAVRGYNENWKGIHAEVLRSTGIPKYLWYLYDVHHEPDHRAYKLTPLLHANIQEKLEGQGGEGSNLYS